MVGNKSSGNRKRDLEYYKTKTEKECAKYISENFKTFTSEEKLKIALSVNSRSGKQGSSEENEEERNRQIQDQIAEYIRKLRTDAN